MVVPRAGTSVVVPSGRRRRGHRRVRPISRLLRGRDRLGGGLQREAPSGQSGRGVFRGRKSPDFEAFGGLDEVAELGFGDRGLALVHEVHDALDFPAADVLEHYDRVLAGIVDEDLLEVGAARDVSLKANVSQSRIH